MFEVSVNRSNLLHKQFCFAAFDTRITNTSIVSIMLRCGDGNPSIVQTMVLHVSSIESHSQFMLNAISAKLIRLARKHAPQSMNVMFNLMLRYHGVLSSAFGLKISFRISECWIPDDFHLNTGQFRSDFQQKLFPFTSVKWMRTIFWAPKFEQYKSIPHFRIFENALGKNMVLFASSRMWCPNTWMSNASRETIHRVHRKPHKRRHFLVYPVCTSNDFHFNL